MSTKEQAKSEVKVDDPLFNRAEAAAYLGMNERWIKGQLEKDAIPFVKLGRLVRFRKSQLDAFIESRSVRPEDGS